MVDFAMDVHKSLYPDQEVPATLVEKRAQVVEQFKQLQSGTDSVLKIMTEPEVTKQTQQCRDSKQLLEFLMKNFDFKPSMVDTATTSQSFSTSAETTVEQVNICTFIGFWFNQLTKIILMECGESLLQKF